jgi:hypothetical protein
MVPAAQARPLDNRTAVAEKAQSGWFHAALAWLGHLVTGDRLASASASSTASPETTSIGSCIDPWGICW